MASLFIVILGIAIFVGIYFYCKHYSEESKKDLERLMWEQNQERLHPDPQFREPFPNS